MGRDIHANVYIYTHTQTHLDVDNVEAEAHTHTHNNRVEKQNDKSITKSSNGCCQGIY